MKKQNRLFKKILPLAGGAILVASLGASIVIQSSYASKRKSLETEAKNLEIEAKEKADESWKRGRSSVLGLFGSTDFVLRGDREGYEFMIEKSKENERISDSLEYISDSLKIVSDSLKEESLKYPGPFYNVEKFFADLL